MRTLEKFRAGQLTVARSFRSQWPACRRNICIASTPVVALKTYTPRHERAISNEFRRKKTPPRTKTRSTQTNLDRPHRDKRQLFHVHEFVKQQYRRLGIPRFQTYPCYEIWVSTICLINRRWLRSHSAMSSFFMSRFQIDCTKQYRWK